MKRVRYVMAVVSLIPATVPVAVHAQDATDKRIAEMMANAKDAYAIPARPTRCQERAGDEIVVCAPENGDQYRVPGSVSTNTGVPHVDVGTHATPGGVSVRGCFLQKCPKEVYLIDLSKIPLPPPGSDAEKIAKGEMRAP